MTVYVGFKEKLLARPGNAAVNAAIYWETATAAVNGPQIPLKGHKAEWGGQGEEGEVTYLQQVPLESPG